MTGLGFEPVGYALACPPIATLRFDSMLMILLAAAPVLGKLKHTVQGVRLGLMRRLVCFFEGTVRVADEDHQFTGTLDLRREP